MLRSANFLDWYMCKQVKVSTVLGSVAPPLTVKIVQAARSDSKNAPIIENQVSNQVGICCWIVPSNLVSKNWSFFIDLSANTTKYILSGTEVRCWYWIPCIGCFAERLWCWEIWICFQGAILLEVYLWVRLLFSVGWCKRSDHFASFFFVMV